RTYLNPVSERRNPKNYPNYNRSLQMEPRKEFPSPRINYEGLLEWNLSSKELRFDITLLGKDLTAQDLPHLFQLLSPEVRLLWLGGNFFCCTQSKRINLEQKERLLS